MFGTSRLDRQISVDWKVILKTKKGTAHDPRLRDFYNAFPDNFSMPLAHASFVALDFETTGLDPQSHDILSIGAIPFSLERIRCQEARQWLVNPQRGLNEESVIIHGITHSDIDNAPDLKRILDEVLDTLAGKIIVVHYHPIERDFFKAALLKRLGEEILFPVIDTMVIEDHIQRKTSRKLLSRLRGRRPLSVRLGDSRERYGLPGYKPHHAITDALATAELFQAQVAHHYSARTSLAELLI